MATMCLFLSKIWRLFGWGSKATSRASATFFEGMGFGGHPTVLSCFVHFEGVLIFFGVRQGF